MYKVLIADDEKRICSLIKALIDWERMDLQLVGTASNGREALEIIREKSPDIIITDVRMPEMDGIELMRTLHEEGLTSRVIVISGYAEFEYAHAAIQYGVHNYLLKPIQKDELNTAMEKIIKELADNNKTKQHFEQAGEQLKRSREALRNHITQIIVEGGRPNIEETKGDIRYRLVMFLLLFRSKIPFCDAETVTTQQLQAMEEPMKSLMPGFFSTGDKIWCLITYQKGSNWKDAVQWTADLLSEKIYAYGEIKIAVSNEYRQPEAGMADEAIRARCWQWRYPLQEIVCHDELPPCNNIPPEKKHAILENLELLDAEKAEQMLREYANDLQKKEPAMLYTEMLSLWETFCSLHGEAFLREEKKREGSFLIGQSQSDHQIVEETVQLIRKGIEDVASAKEGQEDYYVRAAKRYIQEHLRESLNLDNVSSAVHISPTYLSALFTKKAETNFKDYVIKMRINEAKQMLKYQPELSISQIGNRVGYPDQQYFSKLFSKVVGLKPSKYRKLHQ